MIRKADRFVRLTRSGPFDSYLNVDEAYAFVQGYQTSCPSNSTQVSMIIYYYYNALCDTWCIADHLIQLPFTAFPSLYVNGHLGGTNGSAGATVQLSWNGSTTATQPLFLNVASEWT